MAPPVKKPKIFSSDNHRPFITSSTAIGEHGQKQQQQLMGSFVRSDGKRRSFRMAKKMENRRKIGICNDVWLDICPFFCRPQIGLKLALISARFNALVDKHFDGKSELTIWRPFKIGKMGALAKLSVDYGANSLLCLWPERPLPAKIRFDELQIGYVDQSVVEFLRTNQKIFDHLGTCLSVSVGFATKEKVQRIWDILVREIWPIFATNIHHFRFPNGDYLDNFNICSIDSGHLFPALITGADHADDDGGPNANCAAAAADGQALAKWLHTPSKGGQPKQLCCWNHDAPATTACWMNKYKAAFLRATTTTTSSAFPSFSAFLSSSAFPSFSASSSVICYKIQFHLRASTPIVPFELVNERTNEKLTLSKESECDWVMKRCQLGQMVQWDKHAKLNNVGINIWGKKYIGPLSSDVGIWKKCNGKNGTILVENDCTKLLICYQSEMAKNRKIGKRFGVGKGNIGKLKFVECAEEIGENQWHDAEPLGNELQEALSSAAFFDDFMPFVLAFEFGATFCAENGGTTKLYKEKCLSQTLVAPKTKVFAFVPFARHVDHFGTNCTTIFFPTEVDKFLLNITITPYDIGCKKYQRPLKMKDPEGPPSEKHRYFDACNKVPTEEKCENSEELIGCYKSSKKWHGNSPIAEMCQKHLEGISGGANANVAGFIVKICAHRNENDLVIESTFNISFSNETCKRTRTFPISLEKITDIKHWMPTFLIEFGTDKWKSAICEKADEKSICEELKMSDGIGTMLNDIEPQMVDGTLAKMIHFVPPLKHTKMFAFFQIERPKFSKFITIRTKLLPYQNDPNNTRRATPCDYYGDDCVPIKNLLLKIEALENCGKNESENNAAFKKPGWAPPHPPEMPWKKPSETLICEGDLVCDKQTLQQQYNRLREICGLKPEEVENQRKKRQYYPYQKWTKSPIKITFNKTALPKDGYQKWKDAIEIGAALIMEVTCVRFEFVDEMVDGENGIAIADTLTVCGRSPVGRVGGWQFLELGMTMGRCINYFNMSVVACHELLHALGFRHEQSRNSCKGHEDKCQNGGYLNPNDCTKCHCPDGYGGEYCKELEENLNCEDLSGITRELLANQSAVLLKAEAKCGGNGPCRCHWRIKPEAGKKVRIQFKILSNLFECTYNCSSAYVEVKYRADKRAQGAKLCCAGSLTDLNANEYKNWIEAEKPDMDIVISARLSPKWTVPSTVFELTYSGNVKLIKSSKCRYAGNLFVEKRNPGSGTLQCYDAVKQKYNDCPCADGDKKCLTEEKWSYDHFVCPILRVNGIQIPKHPRYNWARIDIVCYKAEGDTVSFWGYSKPETKEIIRVDEVQCLQAWAVAVPKQSKSLQVEEQPPLAKIESESILGQ
ncbi:hypothetical protein niasHT_018634 [Heterodera trifolii]|uniref:EGF-like domain-containing protein n=1 Tax=Heterodera trifolii TaxID=157864 RepID=A0ABD2KZ86_9BILA